MAKQKENEQSNVLTTESVNNIIIKENKGIPLKRHEHLWFKNIKGVRKANLTFAMTNEELSNYFKCKMSVHFFAENFCKIKTEDGTIQQMKLRDYQKDIIDLYTKNRFSILMASRQTGKCVSMESLVTVRNDVTGKIYSTYLFELLYSTIKLHRKLTFLENIKYFLYKIYVKF